MHYTTCSPEETIRLGENLGREFLHAGAVITVRGELGAGKTHFVKGIAGALGIDERALTSPTFALANEYECLLNGKRFTLYHLDCYRFEKEEELLELGVEDYLYPHTGATIIEWPERIAGLVPVHAIRVEITARTETERSIVVTLPQQ